MVVVESWKGSDNPVAGLFGKGVGHQVCWISGSQLTRVSAAYRTTTATIQVGRRPASSRSTERTSGTWSGCSVAPQSKCQLVHVVGLLSPLRPEPQLISQHRAQAAIYAALYVVLLGSGLLFLSQYGTSVRFWVGFTTAYLLLLVTYTLYLFVLLFVHDVRPRSYPRYAGQKIAVLIPCFNEDPALVEESIRTVLAGEGRKQVIVIDDGSTNGVQERLRGCRRAADLAARVSREPRQARGAASRGDATARRRRRLRRHDRQRHRARADALVRVVEPLLCPEIGRRRATCCC